MSLIAEIQAANLEFAHLTQFAAHNERAIVFQAYSSTDNTLIGFFSLSDGWDINEYQADGSRLPENVFRELVVAENRLSIVDYARAVAVQHQGVIYQIIQPSPFVPVGKSRFYRFWLSPQENES